MLLTGAVYSMYFDSALDALLGIHTIHQRFVS